jgi:hypothetical protein
MAIVYSTVDAAIANSLLGMSGCWRLPVRIDRPLVPE